MREKGRGKAREGKEREREGKGEVIIAAAAVLARSNFMIRSQRSSYVRHHCRCHAMALDWIYRN